MNTENSVRSGAHICYRKSDPPPLSEFEGGVSGSITGGGPRIDFYGDMDISKDLVKPMLAA